MTPNLLLDIFNFLRLAVLAKIIMVVLGVFYVVFTAVVYRQITLMTQILDSKISPLVKTTALLQIGAGVFILILAVVLA